jgi:diguanylate cyclase (GGDEF)-like protein
VRGRAGAAGAEREKGTCRTESIGVAAFSDDGRDRATLIARADLALYHAKHTGRNRVVTWTEAEKVHAAQGAQSKKAS